MCGIAGAIGSVTDAVQHAVLAASERQHHRGPDDHGLWRSEPPGGAGAVFGFRRLAIIDLSPDGHQPMVDSASGNVIAFNGEIYNFAELKRELESLGETFVSRSDTEVVLKAYARWGDEAIAKLRGMFAIAIWNARQRTVLLARDRLGIKPLYVCTATGPDGRPLLLFASELRALLATGLVARRIDRDALDSYLWNGFVIGPEALIAGVRLLPPGTTATVDPRAPACSPRPYWRLPPAGDDRADGTDILRHELETAMRQHLVSDVPLGIFLSGGVDSSAIAALAARVSPQGAASVRTFNISFDEAGFDESPHARAVAKALATEHTDVRLTQGHFVEHLDDALAAMDQPTFDGINTWFVSNAVRKAGMTVALAGTGGDELFGGYRSFTDVPRAARIADLVRWLPRRLLRVFARGIARAKLGRFGEVPPQTRWGKLGDVLCSGGDLLANYQISYSLFTEEIHADLLRHKGGGVRRGIPAARAAELAALIRDCSPLHAVATLETANFLGERLLRDTDWAGMAASLEVRVPLLDHRVVEAAAAIAPARRFAPLGRKMLLRELALAELDPAIFDRAKSGFVLPIETWCRQTLEAQVAEVLQSRDLCRAAGVDHETVGKIWRTFQSGAPGMYWSRVWSLYVLLRWCDAHGASA